MKHALTITLSEEDADALAALSNSTQTAPEELAALAVHTLVSHSKDGNGQAIPPLFARRAVAPGSALKQEAAL